MAEYKAYRILTTDSGSKLDLRKELAKEVPPEYQFPSTIPSRPVKIYDYLPTNINSRVATYMLTDEEVRVLLGDERIIDISLLDDLFDIFNTASYQEANYSRISEPGDLDLKNNFVNWGLYSCTHNNIPVESIKGLINDQNTELDDWIGFKEKYEYTLDGTGVDLIVINSDKIHPFHLDFYDPTFTYSRLQTASWGEIAGLNPEDLTTLPTYSFDRLFTASYHYYLTPEEVYNAAGYLPSGFDIDSRSPEISYHGFQCLSIAGGSIFGWAKNATLYYLNPFDPSYIYDVIRIFHENKPIDPNTGYKRPTIVNQSTGGVSIDKDSFEIDEGIFYSGSYHPGVTSSLEYGFINNKIPAYRKPLSDVPLTEMTDAGVIFVHSSMNSAQIFFRASPDTETSYPIPDRYRSIHFDNYISSSEINITTPGYILNLPNVVLGGTAGKWYYHRGVSPTNLATVEVGALNRSPIYNPQSASLITNKESAAWYGNHGGGTDIYAPTEVASAHFLSVGNRTSSLYPSSPNLFPYPYYSNNATITKGTTYTFTGTSFAAPQVAGVACLYFQMNPGADVWQFKQFLLDHAKPVRIPPSEDNGGPIDVWAEGNVKNEEGIDYVALNGAPTASLFWPYSSPNKAIFKDNMQITKSK